MAKFTLEEIKKQTKSVEKKYIIGALLLLLVFLTLFITTCNAGGKEEEAVDAVVKPAWDTSVRINEVMTDNSTVAPGANGRYYDWIELFNASDSVFDLSGFYLSDNPDKLDKFLIEDLKIEPGEYVLVYMSRLTGKDENGILHTNFALSSLGETIYLSDSMSNIMNMITVPAGGSNVSYGVLDNKLVWMSTPTPGGPNSGSGSDDLDSLEYEVVSVRINEYMTRNKSIIYDCEGDYNDWIELYNNTEETVDLTGYTMTDNPENIDKWSFPEGTVIKPGEYLLVFCSGKDKIDESGYIHSGFRLGGEDTEIMIFSSQDRLAAKETLVFIPENSSYGYVSDSDMKLYFSMPTPGRENDTLAVSYTAEQLKKMQGIFD